MIRRIFSSFTLFMLVLVPAAHAGETEARDFVQKLGDNVLGIVDDGAMSASQKEDRLTATFSSAVDVDWVGKFVLGKYWRRATDEQKTRYQELYRTFLLRGYASRFKEYRQTSASGFVITGSREIRENEYQIDSEIIRTGEAPVLVSYRVRFETGNYKLFDVIIEGVSQLATQRSEFGALIARKGMDQFIDMLESKVNQVVSSKSVDVTAPAS